MKLQGIIQQIKDALVPTSEADTLIAAFLQETKGTNSWSLRPSDFPGGRAVLTGPPRRQADVLLRLIEKHDASAHAHRSDSLLMALLGHRLPLTGTEMDRVLTGLTPSDAADYFPSHLHSMGPKLVRTVREHLEAGNELSPAMRSALGKMRDKSAQYQGTEWRKLTRAFGELLGDTFAGLPDAGTAWAEAALADLSEMEQPVRDAWAALFVHVATADGSKPSAKWLTAGDPHRGVIGTTEFGERVTKWMNKVSPPAAFKGTAPAIPAGGPPYNSAEWEQYKEALNRYNARVAEYQKGISEKGISEKNIAMLKGLAWYAADGSSADLARALGYMCQAAFHSLPERGPWAKSAGNAAIWALGQMPNGVGVGPLARLRTKMRDRGALKLIAAGIETAAAKAGMTVDALEDITVPTGGLDVDGTRHETFGEDGAVTLTLDTRNAKTNLQWFGADGKPRKAVPAAVKAQFAAEVKALKAAEDEIKQALGAQAARLDRALLDERRWTGAEWRERYLPHPVLGSLTRRLIWTFDGRDGLPVGNQILAADGDALPDLRDDTIVRLWHPVGHAPAAVLRWRDALEARGIVQPFKQAHREVYLLTDAERATRTYSNRFAAHILKQHQFNSLAALRGWKNQLRLMVDDSYPPATKLLPQHNLRAEYWVEGIGEDYGTDTNDAGTYLRLVTDQVRFYPLDAASYSAHAGGGGYAANHRDTPAESVPLDRVPPLVLSEVMRDVDLFVGVASLGNDPEWADGGPQGRFRNYWQEYSFGDLTETARTRADVLTRLLPRLKIADRCRLDGRFLRVRGDRRSYKIHLGSGNILMEPHDQYLCIVPESGADEAGGLSLPFEGDRTLSVIISKAFLLAADTRITDPTITSQIGVR